MKFSESFITAETQASGNGVARSPNPIEDVIKRVFEVVYQEIDDGWIMATVPDLPGAVTQGRDVTEALANIQEAIELVLESYHEQARRQISSRAVRQTMTLEVAPV